MPVTIRFAPDARRDLVSDLSVLVLQDILSDAGLQGCKVTSTLRTPQEQAEVMYRNLARLGVASQKKLYGRAGDQVIEAYERCVARGATRAETVQAMLATINELGASNVSRHCCDPAESNVIDVAPSSIADHAAFLRALQGARDSGRVSKFFSPGDGDPAFHIEIPQDQPAAGGLQDVAAGQPVLMAMVKAQTMRARSGGARVLRAHYTRLPRRLRVRARARRRLQRRR